jgi:hypothetical protein
MRPALLAHTDRIGYIPAWDEQRRLADLVRSGDAPTVMWLLEHDPVYTYGRHGTRDDLFITDEVLAGMGATCVATDRGGQIPALGLTDSQQEPDHQQCGAEQERHPPAPRHQLRVGQPDQGRDDDRRQQSADG